VANGHVDAERVTRERRKTMRWSADAIRAREQAREEERCRLARELHDDLGQAMTGLKMDLSWLERQLADVTGNDEMQGKLRLMTQVVDHCIHTLRSVITELRPQTLDQLGLIPSLEWQIDTFGRRFGLRTNFTSTIESLDIDRGRATAVFRMFQEMLTNVGRHAKASRVNVRVELEANTLVLTVQDNGRGVRSAKTAPSSTGILGMRERAALLNGEIHVTSRPRRGTTVAVRLPLANRRGTARTASDQRVRP
jgi:signal transduction histidine kinase